MCGDSLESIENIDKSDSDGDEDVSGVKKTQNTEMWDLGVESWLG